MGLGERRKSVPNVRAIERVKQFVKHRASNELATRGRCRHARPRSIFGVPLFSLPEGEIAEDTVWALDRAKVYAVIRQDIGVMVDPRVFSAQIRWLSG